MAAISGGIIHATVRISSILALAAGILAFSAPLAPAKGPATAETADQTVPSGGQINTSPQKLSAQLKKSLAKVRSSCVSVYTNGSGSGVVISPEGLVLTAAHMMRGIKSDDHIKIEFDDGRKALARLLGFNRESDMALLKIEDASENHWPHCELAEKAPLTGGFCFTVAHPSGRMKNRPAQVRLGRITSHSTRGGKTFRLFADCNIQPGDSGGPLFSMDGKLIGLDSSAGNLLGFNIFPAIDQYHADREKLLAGKRWGDIKKAPDGAEFKKISLSAEMVPKVRDEFLRRIKMQYPPAIDFVRTLKNVNGSVVLDQEELLAHMPRVVIAIAKNQPLSLGLDDPRLGRQLTTLSASSGRAVPLRGGGALLGHGTVIDSRHIVTKASLLPKKMPAPMTTGGKNPVALERVATDEDWDLAILKAAKPIKLAVVQWPASNAPPVQAGDLLQSKDSQNRTIWNVATDQARSVGENCSVGPIEDKSLISKRRAPYPLGIRHALPLFAKGAGTPVFNQNGEFVGMHIARLSRTLGLLVPAEQLRQRCAEMLASPVGAGK